MCVSEGWIEKDRAIREKQEQRFLVDVTTLTTRIAKGRLVMPENIQHLQHRVQTHMFLCVLAYHLLVAIENLFLRRGIHMSWGTLREQRATYQVVTVVLPTSTGHILRIRKGTIPEKVHQDIYHTLEIPAQIMVSVKTWTTPDSH